MLDLIHSRLATGPYLAASAEREKVFQDLEIIRNFEIMA